MLEKATAPLADKIICVSKHDRIIGIKAGMNAKQLMTVHNRIKDISPNLVANSTKSQVVKVAIIARFDRQKYESNLTFEHIDRKSVV